MEMLKLKPVMCLKTREYNNIFIYIFILFYVTKGELHIPNHNENFKRKKITILNFQNLLNELKLTHTSNRFTSSLE